MIVDVETVQLTGEQHLIFVVRSDLGEEFINVKGGAVVVDRNNGVIEIFAYPLVASSSRLRKTYSVEAVVRVKIPGDDLQ